VWQQSRNELRTLYTGQKYFFVTSCFQACVLLQFNAGGDSLSYDDIALGTGMNAENLKPVLALLCKQRVIDLKDDMYELNLSTLSPSSGALQVQILIVSIGWSSIQIKEDSSHAQRCY
jgi:hypothetical protein